MKSKTNGFSIWVCLIIAVVGFVLGYVSGIHIPKEITFTVRMDAPTIAILNKSIDAQNNLNEFGCGRDIIYSCPPEFPNSYRQINSSRDNETWWQNYPLNWSNAGRPFGNCCYPPECDGLYNNSGCNHNCVYPVMCFTINMTSGINITSNATPVELRPYTDVSTLPSDGCDANYTEYHVRAPLGIVFRMRATHWIVWTINDTDLILYPDICEYMWWENTSGASS